MKKSILMFAVFAMSLVAMSWTVTVESTCDKCGGEGSVTCPTCEGKARYQCAKCGGSGTVTFQGSTYECGICEGSGYNDCRTCDGKGKVLCTRCFGRGTIHTND